MSLIKGLHHAALRCCGKAEMDCVIEFYCNVLGMKRLRSCDEMISSTTETARHMYVMSPTACMLK